MSICSLHAAQIVWHFRSICLTKDKDFRHEEKNTVTAVLDCFVVVVVVFFFGGGGGCTNQLDSSDVRIYEEYLIWLRGILYFVYFFISCCSATFHGVNRPTDLVMDPRRESCCRASTPRAARGHECTESIKYRSVQPVSYSMPSNNNTALLCLLHPKCRECGFITFTYGKMNFTMHYDKIHRYTHCNNFITYPVEFYDIIRNLKHFSHFSESRNF